MSFPRTRAIITVAVCLMLAGLVGPAQAPASAPYVDPALAAHGQQSVIVTAESAAAAAEAVRSAGGTVTSELWLIDAVGATLPAGAVAALAARPGVRSVIANYGVRSSDWDGWVTDLPLPSAWDGRPDAQPTADPSVWQVVNPVPVDIGADVLHATTLPSGDTIRGQGVTVAVVDSGVYFDPAVRAELGPVLTSQFVGQADFVASTCTTTTNARGRTRVVGRQRDGYCWLNHADTMDGYGHGTAVASIIWNNFTDANTGVTLGVAPGASVLSVRVLDDSGVGSYETVIKGLQFVVKFKGLYHVRVLNLSISAKATVPYFVDPLNRAVEMAWLKGVTVIAAAGNDGPAPGSVTVPGNDPYVITVGALDELRTPGYWADDTIPTWSAAGPTGDGFVKPDLVAPGVNIISFMHKDPADPARSQRIVQLHPDNAITTSLFRMNGTSMAAAVASGAAALVVQANPDLKPDEVKYRLMASARPAALGAPTRLVYPIFKQGMGRLWVPDAALGSFSPDGDGNPGMNLRADLLHGYVNPSDLAYHYQGLVRSAPSDDGSASLYYMSFADGHILGLGAWSDEAGWLDGEVLGSKRLIWSIGGAPVGYDGIAWMGGSELATVDSSKRLIWSISRNTWEGAADASAMGLSWQSDGTVDSSKRLIWSISRSSWDGGLLWQGASVEASKRLIWSLSMNTASASAQSTSWVEMP